MKVETKMFRIDLADLPKGQKATKRNMKKLIKLDKYMSYPREMTMLEYVYWCLFKSKYLI